MQKAVKIAQAHDDIWQDGEGRHTWRPTAPHRYTAADLKALAEYLESLDWTAKEKRIAMVQEALNGKH